jgi:glucose-1-phosphate thymidylyltransferase
MHDFVSAGRLGGSSNDGMSLDGKHEVHVSDVIQGAMQVGMKIETVIFENGSCLDIGTPEDMLKAVRLLSSQELAE